MSEDSAVVRVPFEVSQVDHVSGVFPAMCTVSPPLTREPGPRFWIYLHQSLALVEPPAGVNSKDFVIDEHGIHFTTSEDLVPRYLELTDLLIARANRVAVEHAGEPRPTLDTEHEVLERLKSLTGK